MSRTQNTFITNWATIFVEPPIKGLVLFFKLQTTINGYSFPWKKFFNWRCRNCALGRAHSGRDIKSNLFQIGLKLRTLRFGWWYQNRHVKQILMLSVVLNLEGGWGHFEPPPSSPLPSKHKEQKMNQGDFSLLSIFVWLYDDKVRGSQ